MSTYEYVVDGQVVERVSPIDGDHEDTRLGCAALDRAEDADGWRKVVDVVEHQAAVDEPLATPVDPAPTDTSTPPKPTAPKRGAKIPEA
ncbi:MAG: hypothetical protein ABIQ18_02330 [Umezawaea sp.]